MANNHKVEAICFYCDLSCCLLLLRLLLFSFPLYASALSSSAPTSPPLLLPLSDPVEMEYEEAVSKVTLQQIIRDLEPFTSYTFYVKAYTSHGASKPSDSATESTYGEGELKAEPKVPDLFQKRGEGIKCETVRKCSRH